MNLKLIDKNWLLELEKGDENMIFCPICDKIVENSGFFCRNHHKLRHNLCENNDNHQNCRGKDVEHTHFKVTIVKKEGFGKEKGEKNE